MSFKSILDLESFWDVIPSAVSIVYLIGIWVGYRFLIVLYNISPFHPLVKFPGPKIAAASYLYEAYYDWWLVGRYGHEIRRMHERYGRPKPWTRAHCGFG